MIHLDEGERPWTVTELAEQIQRELQPLRSVFVKGELSGLRLSAKGHYYFTIKDADSAMSAFLFQNVGRRIGLVPENGHEYIFRGKVDYWAQGGQLRLVVDHMQFDDLGRMRADLEALKTKLELEGAFSPQRKRPIPFLPRVVALITSPTGAVIHDLQQTIFERFENMTVLVYPVLVQGPASPQSVSGALRRCNQDAIADVVVVARGGGSFEELYGFNSEIVVRSILNSQIPVVTALGHTSDRTLADMVADAECRTPTEAGNRVVPKKADLLLALDERRRRLDREAQSRLAVQVAKLEERRRRLEMVPPALLRARQNRLLSIRQGLARLSPDQQLQRRQEGVSERKLRLAGLAQRCWAGRTGEINARQVPLRLDRWANASLDGGRRSLEQREARLQALSPTMVLRRGYSINFDEDGRALRSWTQTTRGARLRVRLGEGELTTQVEETRDGG